MAHFPGTVMAYEALYAYPDLHGSPGHPRTTAGSARRDFYRLQPGLPAQGCVRPMSGSWVNFGDQGDLVAMLRRPGPLMQTSGRGTSREGEASTVPSDRNEELAQGGELTLVKRRNQHVGLRRDTMVLTIARRTLPASALPPLSCSRPPR